MKKLFPALLAVLLLLTACGGSSRAKSDMSANDKVMYETSAADADYGWTADNAAPMEPEIPGEDIQYGGAQSAPPTGVKLIYTADLCLETKDFDGAQRSLDRIVENLGGYYERHSLDQGGSRRSLFCTIRVPAESFEALLEQAGQAAHITSCQRYKEDVSEVYYDTEARLKTQQTKLDRLHALLEKAATMEDIIALESALSETELQIERLTGSLRHYDSLIGYSTVTVSLCEVYKLSTDEELPQTFSQRLAAALSSGFRRGMDNLEDFVISLARNWMGVLVLLAAVTAAICFRRWRRRRKQAVRPAASPADEPQKK